MTRIILIYGVIGGLIVALGMTLGMSAVPHGGALGMAVGYLTMLIAMSMVFVGVRQYRTTVGGGVIRFWPAFGLGLAIGLVASLFYVATWEVHLWLGEYRFMADYVQQAIAQMRASGASAAEVATFTAQMEQFARDYEQLPFRMAVTLSEIAPVVILVALISAGVLRNSRWFPATRV
jgi:hypothetical protein